MAVTWKIASVAVCILEFCFSLAVDNICLIFVHIVVIIISTGNGMVQYGTVVI